MQNLMQTTFNQNAEDLDTKTEEYVYSFTMMIMGWFSKLLSLLKNIRLLEKGLRARQEPQAPRLMLAISRSRPLAFDSLV